MLKMAETEQRIAMGGRYQCTIKNSRGKECGHITLTQSAMGYHFAIAHPIHTKNKTCSSRVIP